MMTFRMAGASDGWLRLVTSYYTSMTSLIREMVAGMWRTKEFNQSKLTASLNFFSLKITAQHVTEW